MTLCSFMVDEDALPPCRTCPPADLLTQLCQASGKGKQWPGLCWGGGGRGRGWGTMSLFWQSSASVDRWGDN